MNEFLDNDADRAAFAAKVQSGRVVLHSNPRQCGKSWVERAWREAQDSGFYQQHSVPEMWVDEVASIPVDQWQTLRTLGVIGPQDLAVVEWSEIGDPNSWDVKPRTAADFMADWMAFQDAERQERANALPAFPGAWPPKVGLEFPR